MLLSCYFNTCTTFYRMMMGLSYTNIICHLKMLKQERRILTNWKKKDKIIEKTHSLDKISKIEKEENVTRQEQTSPEVTTNNSSDEANRQICETVTTETLNTNYKDLEKTSCSNMRVVGNQNDKNRRFSEFDAFRKVCDVCPFCLLCVAFNPISYRNCEIFLNDAL